MHTIVTQRLKGHAISPRDQANINLMHENSLVMAKQGGIQSHQTSVDYLKWNKQHWEREGFGIWILHSLETDQFVGQAGIRIIEIGGMEENELIYAFMPEYWGQGLATEIGRVSLAMAFECLKQESVICFAALENKASFHVMEKLGFSFEKYFMLEGIKNALYRLSKQKYFKIAR